MHAIAIYYLLENEIVPLFYERRDHGTREWMQRVKQSIKYLSPRFDCGRMVREYDRELYDPAHLAYSAQLRSQFENARRRVRWNLKVREAWDRVRFLETGPAPAGPVTSGITVPVRSFGLPQRFLDTGKRADVLAAAGLSAQEIARQLVESIARHDAIVLPDRAT